MPWNDRIGHVFPRRRDVKEVFGGDWVKGISSSDLEETVIVVSDPNESRYGYRDRFLADGSYEYYGQRAQAADAWQNNNHMIRDHAVAGRSLLLFLKEHDEYRFDGEWFYNGHRIIEVGQRNHPAEQVVFNLVRGAALAQEQLEGIIREFLAEDDDTIRARAIAAGRLGRDPHQGIVNIYRRSAAVSAHVLRRANGRCECCGIEAPFDRTDGRPYLECHHITRVADYGPDDIYSVIALHPVCHRFVHYAEGGADRNDQIRELMARIEPRPAGGER